MEGQERVRDKKSAVCIIIIVLFHVVGLVGFFTPALLPLFLKIVPFHILLMLGVITYSHQWFDVKFTAFIAVTFILGFAVEWIGVHTHLIFGNYAYGETLGLKLLDIPLMIGVNWFLLVYSIGVLMQCLRLKSVTIRVLLGSLALVLLDLSIEPVAVKFDYWHWQTHTGILTAPFGNYLGWFIVSALMLGIFELFRFKRQNVVAIVLVVTQFLFFGLLQLA